mmetsp:Transcript_4048/g.14192  ORF Transcript_4048/g.14192 Transcript_4048/m.14192 type:complete len:252 (-) Transcript_4048:351-1106(-)
MVPRPAGCPGKVVPAPVLRLEPDEQVVPAEELSADHLQPPQLPVLEEEFLDELLIPSPGGHGPRDQVAEQPLLDGGERAGLRSRVARPHGRKHVLVVLVHKVSYRPQLHQPPDGAGVKQSDLLVPHRKHAQDVLVDRDPLVLGQPHEVLLEDDLVGLHAMLQVHHVDRDPLVGGRPVPPARRAALGAAGHQQKPPAVNARGEGLAQLLPLTAYFEVEDRPEELVEGGLGAVFRALFALPLVPVHQEPAQVQ